MILFLGLRAEEPEELYHRNPSLKEHAGMGRKGKLPGEIVIFALHKLRLSSAKNANSDAAPSPCRRAACPAQAGRRYVVLFCCRYRS
jgi:hypothetical protein